jgi:hypothetical protein
MMRGVRSNGWLAAAAVLVAGLSLTRGAEAASVRLMVRTDEPDERVFVGNRRLDFNQGLASTDVPSGRVILRRELGGVKWSFPYDVDPTKVLRLPAWPRLAVDGLSERERDSAALHTQPGVLLRPGRETPVPEGAVLVDLKRGGKVVETVEVPAAAKGRTSRYMAWPLMERSCETDEGATRAKEFFAALREDAFLHIDLSLLPPGTKAIVRFGRCEFKSESGRLKVPPAGWRGDVIPVQVEGLGSVEVPAGSGGDQRTLVDADLAAELCSSPSTRRDGERMAAAAAAPEAGGLEIRYEGFSEDGAMYLESGECRLTGARGLLRVPRRGFLERAVLRFQPRCGSMRPCPAVILRKSMPTDPNGYPLVVDEPEIAGLEGTVDIHRVPHGAEVSVNGMPAVARPIGDGLSLDLRRGTYTLTLNAPGRWPWSKSIEVRHGSHLEVQDARLDLRSGGWPEKLGKAGAAVGVVGAALVAGAFVFQSSNQALLDADARQGPLAAGDYRALVDGTRAANRLALSGGIALGVGALSVAGWSLLAPSGRSPAPEWADSAGEAK